MYSFCTNICVLRSSFYHIYPYKSSINYIYLRYFSLYPTFLAPLLIIFLPCIGIFSQVSSYLYLFFQYFIRFSTYRLQKPRELSGFHAISPFPMKSPSALHIIDSSVYPSLKSYVLSESRDLYPLRGQIPAHF